MAKNTLMEIVTKIVDLLEPLKPEERKRVLDSVFAFLGEPHRDPNQKNGDLGDHGQPSHVHASAKPWMKQYSISTEEIEQVFNDADGTLSVIATLPGKTNKEKTLNGYVLEGLRKLLSTGKGTFDDQSARDICVSSGCYDQKNHASILKGKGNWFSGSKDGGWTLTAPGLKHGAELVKEVNKKPE
jgi:hypothetical protein